MTDQTPTPAPEPTLAAPLDETAFEHEMRRFRERVMAIIAFIVLLVYLPGMAFLAIQYGSDTTRFSALKDLFLFVNPLLAFVIGFYFNKVTTESRAENAESTARSASLVANQAVQSREQAVDEVEAAREKMEAAREYVEEVGQAFNQLEQPLMRGGTLSDDGETSPVYSYEEMRRTLERARRALN